MPVVIHTNIAPPPKRDWRQAMGRGMACRCPACGNGKLFNGFLKPVAVCASCGEELSHQRADDLPPYIIITIVGHIVVGGLLLAEQYADWSFTTYMVIWPLLTVVLSMALMQPVKGAVIGLQWAFHMHGFDNGMPDSQTSSPRIQQEGT